MLAFSGPLQRPSEVVGRAGPFEHRLTRPDLDKRERPFQPNLLLNPPHEFATVNFEPRPRRRKRIRRLQLLTQSIDGGAHADHGNARIAVLGKQTGLHKFTPGRNDPAHPASGMQLSRTRASLVAYNQARALNPVTR